MYQLEAGAWLNAQPVSAIVEPASTNASAGASVTLCVIPTGTPPFTYQWQKNGVNLPGQTNDCLTLTNLTAVDGGSYRASVRHPDRTIRSEEATLTVDLTINPAGDAFSASTEIFALSNDVQGGNAGSSREPGEPAHAGRSSSNSVWYTWTAPLAGIATFDTQGSTFDTVLAVYTGPSLDNLVEVASDDDSGGFHTSRVQWNATENTTYHVAIDSLAAEEGTYNCRWNLEFTDETIPEFTAKPASVTVPWGGTAVFSATVGNPEPGLNFQWLRNGVPLPGANATTLTIPYVNESHLGHYVLAVTNDVGRFVTTPPASLEIGPDPGVQSQDKVGELPADTGAGGGGSLAGSFGGTFSLAAGTIINQQFFNAGTSDRCEPAHCNVPGGASRWFQLVAETNGICTVDTQGSDADTVLAVYLQNFQICTHLFDPLVGCNNDVAGGCARILSGGVDLDRSSRYSFPAPAGSVYRVVVDTVDGAPGNDIHFNVEFSAPDEPPPRIVMLDEFQRVHLALPDSGLTLRVAPAFEDPENIYEWRVDDRPLAGVTGPALSLPRLNYSDAGHYSVLIESPSDPIILPGLLLSVAVPCVETENGGVESAAARMHLLGAASGNLNLEAAATLGSNGEWTAVGTVPPSRKPVIWDTSNATNRFYRIAPANP